MKNLNLRFFFLSFILSFWIFQATYAEDLIINKEKLSDLGKIQETQTYIDIVWKHYVYREPAYAYKLDPARAPYFISPQVLSKTSIANSPTSSKAKTDSTKTATLPKVTEQKAVEIKTSPDTIEMPKTEVAKTEMPKVIENIPKDTAKTDTTILEKDAPAPENKIEISQQAANPVPNVNTEVTIINQAKTETTTATISATQQANKEMATSLTDLQLPKADPVPDRAAAAPFESFVEELEVEI